MLKGKAILEDATALGIATETAVFKHLFARYYAQNVRFTYWRGKKDHEVDLVAEVEGEMVPFKIKCPVPSIGHSENEGTDGALRAEENLSRLCHHEGNG